MFLSEDDLHDLTGYVRAHEQKRWLIRHGLQFVENAAGHPRVLKSVVEAKLGGASVKPTRRGPNLGAIL